MFALCCSLMTACGGQTRDEQSGLIVQSGGSGAGASGGAAAGGSASYGGSSSSGTTSSVGCPGEPVTQPTITSGRPTCRTPLPADSALFAGLYTELLQTVTAGGCTYPAPSSIPLNVSDTASEYTDPNNLSVVFETHGQAPEMFPNVQVAAECDDSHGGWYFDNNSSPGLITLCPCGCIRVNSLQGVLYMIGFPVICVTP